MQSLTCFSFYPRSGLQCCVLPRLLERERATDQFTAHLSPATLCTDEQTDSSHLPPPYSTIELNFKHCKKLYRAEHEQDACQSMTMPHRACGRPMFQKQKLERTPSQVMTPKVSTRDETVTSPMRALFYQTAVIADIDQTSQNHYVGRARSAEQMIASKVWHRATDCFAKGCAAT